MEMGVNDTAWSLLKDSGTGDKLGYRIHILQPKGTEVESTFLPEWSAHTAADSSDRAETKNRCSCYSLAATLLGRKQSHSIQPPPFTFPELKVGSSRNCSNDCQVWYILSTLRTREPETFLPEQQVHTVVNLSDKSGNTEVWQLRYDSCHHWKTKLQTHKPATPSYPTPNHCSGAKQRHLGHLR